MSNQESKSELSFEEALAELESIVESLENGETPLEELIGKYEKGTELLKQCRDKLGDAEMRIQRIEKTKDGFELKELEVES
ncbi:MAG: exodeoxyribonuclease VII small subunit [Opitutales bacterium]|nr:exodeoxyribonuclease VII small subunit [Opitutales bacterium]